MLQRTVTALVTSALLGAVLLIAPAPTAAVSAPYNVNVIVQTPDSVFVKDIGSWKVGTTVRSTLLARPVTIVEIQRGVLNCLSYCDSAGFFLPEGTRGYIIRFLTPGPGYWLYLEDYWSTFSGPYNAIVVDGNESGGEIFVQSASAFRIGGKYLSTVIGSGVVLTITNIVPGRLDCQGDCAGFYLAEGSRGYILTYVSPVGDPYNWFTQDRLVSVCDSSSRTRDRCRPTR
jgi:hypothetical protein